MREYKKTENLRKEGGARVSKDLCDKHDLLSPEMPEIEERVSFFKTKPKNLKSPLGDFVFFLDFVISNKLLVVI
ncbi:MAG: hypothetical protein Q8L47_00605 [bacterium]|nr:hypothetical protein [bacterium]